MKRKTTALLVILTAIIVAITALSLSREQNEYADHDNSQKNVSRHEYVIRAKDNAVYLYDGSKVIKEYDINPLLLPSEDYEMLLNGIPAQSVENADMLAEDFDG